MFKEIDLKKIFKNCLIYAVIYIICIYIIGIILKKFNIRFMGWIYYLSAIIVLFLGVIGLLQLLLKILDKKTKIVLIIVSVAILIPVISFVMWINEIAYNPQYVVNFENKKLVAEVTMFHNTNIIYYDYINTFVMSNTNIDIDVIYTQSAKNHFKIDDKYKRCIEKEFNYYFQTLFLNR